MSADATISAALGIATGYFALGKTEQESRVFSALVELGEIDLDSSRFDLALKLGISQAKVDSLIFRYRISNFDAPSSTAAIATRLKLVRTSARNEEIILMLEDKFYREYFVSLLKKANIASDTSFTRDLITVKAASLPALIACLSNLGVAEVNKNLKRSLRVHQVSSTIDLVTSVMGKVSTVADLIHLLK
jgi:hypothetical protein